MASSHSIRLRAVASCTSSISCKRFAEQPCIHHRKHRIKTCNLSFSVSTGQYFLSYVAIKQFRPLHTKQVTSSPSSLVWERVLLAVPVSGFVHVSSLAERLRHTQGRAILSAQAPRLQAVHNYRSRRHRHVGQRCCPRPGARRRVRAQRHRPRLQLPLPAGRLRRKDSHELFLCTENDHRKQNQ